MQEETLNNQKIQTKQEGKALILTQYKDVNKQGKEVLSEVFYNPLQIFNRDLTVAMIHQYTLNTKVYRKEHFDGITIVDALSASGLRTIRFLKELQDVKKVYANDISEASHKLMMDNFKLNNLDLNKIEMTKKDANQLMYEYMYKSQNDYDFRFDVIDLDPYGSAVPFLDSAIQSAKSGSMICLTCTDSKVLNGPDTQKCYYQYGVSRGRNIQAFQEFALRTVLQTAKTIANKYQKSVEPLFSYMQKEFYCRLFIKISVSKTECAKTFLETGNVYHCEQCSNFHVHSYGKQKIKKDKKDQNFSFVNINKLDLPSQNCNICGGQYDVMGPIYQGEIHNFEFVQQLLDTLQKPETDLKLEQKKKIIGLLQSVIDEKQNFPDTQIPILGVSPKRVGKLIRAQQPSTKQLTSAFQSLGYKFVPTFTNPEVFKTDAPSHILYDVIQKFKQIQVKDENMFKNLEEGQIGYNILKRQINIEPDFDQKIELKKNKMFYLNPKKQGPLPKATVNQLIEEEKQTQQLQSDQQQKNDEQNGDTIEKKVKI